MSRKRARVTEETAGQMYGDVLDRLTERKTPQRPARKTAEPPAVQTSEQPRVKATFYLSREDILVIDRLQSSAFMETGKKPERSHIISRAIQLLGRQSRLGEAESP